MVVSTATAEETIKAIVRAIPSIDESVQPIIDVVAAPVYLTDSEGVVTHFNKACVEYAGRHPEAGRDRWCVTWKLYTLSGAYLPHESCPMATAVLRGQPVRGISAVAERPDGSRVAFTPFPTLIFRGGQLAGAVNILIDITAAWQTDLLRKQADRCRRLALTVTDAAIFKNLKEMADGYEAEARQVELGN
ncbi:MAG TPA: hypothetical protein VNS34_20590 [Rhizobiaceae bacterium]|nr:hypothetical protein [Rhizobiaceae bacterium]